MRAPRPPAAGGRDEPRRLTAAHLLACSAGRCVLAETRRPIGRRAGRPIQVCARFYDRMDPGGDAAGRAPTSSRRGPERRKTPARRAALPMAWAARLTSFAGQVPTHRPLGAREVPDARRSQQEPQAPDCPRPHHVKPRVLAHSSLRPPGATPHGGLGALVRAAQSRRPR